MIRMEQFGMQMILLLFLAAAAVPDIRRKRIPLALLLACIGCGVALQAVFRIYSWPVVLGGAACGGVLLLIGWCSKWKIGAADGLLLIGSGCFLGLWQNLNLLIWSFLAAAGVGIYLLIRGKDKKIAFPFAPCVCAGEGVQLLMFLFG